jgi:large subunit ribosomal protein L32
MAVPKQKISSSRRGQRRSHDSLAAVNAAVCSCGEPMLPHHACKACGMYNGKQVLKVKTEALEA